MTLLVLSRELLGRAEYWPILLSTSCIPALLQLVALPWFPESPRYLFIDRGDEEGSKKGCFFLEKERKKKLTHYVVSKMAGPRALAGSAM